MYSHSIEELPLISWIVLLEPLVYRRLDLGDPNGLIHDSVDAIGNKGK